MIVSSPWEYTALINQLTANLEDTGTPGMRRLDIDLKIRQLDLLHNIARVFRAIERNEPVHREDTTQGGE